MYRVMTCTLHIRSLPVSDEDRDPVEVRVPGALGGRVHTSEALDASGAIDRSETPAVPDCPQAIARRGRKRLDLVADEGAR